MRVDSITPRRLRELRALLDAIAEGPPADCGERWFCTDLANLGREELSDEARRLRLRLLLTPMRERAAWPASWIAGRIERAEELLRARSAAASWSRVRR